LPRGDRSLKVGDTRREPAIDLPLIGRGRDADVFALDDDRVLRRNRDGRGVGDQARLLTFLHEAGYPVPLVHDVSGPDLVMQRLHGPVALEVSVRGGPAHGALLADLHNRLHRIAAPDWLPGWRAGDDRVLHLDLHPANVILTDDGPVVIDWVNARAGDPALDVASTVVLLRSSQPDGVDPAVVESLRHRILDAFLPKVDDDPTPQLANAIRGRQRDANLLPREAEALREWLERIA
jgi:aminoglycoside phosphotransferase (APT) family kinase protein